MYCGSIAQAVCKHLETAAAWCMLAEVCPAEGKHNEINDVCLPCRCSEPWSYENLAGHWFLCSTFIAIYSL